MADFTIKRNDTRPAIEINLTRGGNALGLASTAATPILASAVSLKVKEDGGAWSYGATCVIASAAGGVVRHTWVGNETATAAMANMEVEVLWSDGGVETFPEDSYLSLEIKADLG